jgi:hypothetical protein
LITQDGSAQIQARVNNPTNTLTLPVEVQLSSKHKAVLAVLHMLFSMTYVSSAFTCEHETFVADY